METFSRAILRSVDCILQYSIYDISMLINAYKLIHAAHDVYNYNMFNGWYFYTWNCLLCSIIPMSMKVEWEWDRAHPGVAPVGIVEGERLRLVCGHSVRTVDSCTGREGLR